MTKVAAMHLMYSDLYYGKVEIRSDYGEKIFSLQNNNGAEIHEALISNVKAGDIFSFGLRINNCRDLVGFANDEWGPWIGQNGTIDPYKYQFKILQSDHVLLSMHITQENIPQEPDQVYFPPDYLGLEYSEKPPGSSLIAWLSLEKTDEE
ncbi:hypothetical protein MTO96_027542 [Rhipicephalus appendiculatus]